MKKESYRRVLMGLAINELASQGKITLEYPGHDDYVDNSGVLACEIAGKCALIRWSHSTYGEIKVNLWWDYDEDKHKNSNMGAVSGPCFGADVGIVKSGTAGCAIGAWIERKDGLYIKGNPLGSCSKDAREYLKSLDIEPDAYQLQRI